MRHRAQRILKKKKKNIIIVTLIQMRLCVMCVLYTFDFNNFFYFYVHGYNIINLMYLYLRADETVDVPCQRRRRRSNLI